MEPKNPSQPQYKFSSGIESPALVKTVIEKSLNSLVTLTQQELLAVAPDLRRYYKDQTITRKIPTVGILKADDSEITADDTLSSTFVLQFVQDGKMERRLLTASPIDRLRVIFGTLNGSYKAECVLDQGSEIMAMDKKVWQKIGHELKPDGAMSMESANSQ
ncbi:hypothetical protein CPC08DRAFT_652316, partial [Agrocybe pediades]